MSEQETINNEDKIVSSDNTTPAASASTELVLKTDGLNRESLEIINSIIAETDASKTKDLTYLFNINQNKKTMIRVNKLNELLDIIAAQTTNRFSQKPDEISNQELLQGLKVVQDIIERGQKQIVGTVDQPLIQVNQQNNEINLGEAGEGLTKESRDRIKNAVFSILQGLNSPTPAPDDIIEVVPEEVDTTNKDSEENN